MKFQLKLLPAALALLSLLWSPMNLSGGPVHSVVAAGEEYFHGWPANHGIWSWGDEILVGFTRNVYLYNPNGHSVDPAFPQVVLQGRSTDGGHTWTVEDPPTMIDKALSGPIQFDEPDFAMRFMRGNRLQVSYDRGARWSFPRSFPGFDLNIYQRTNYWIEDGNTARVFKTADKSDGENGRSFYFETTDGGASWQFGNWLSPEPPAGRNEYSIMPSPVLLQDGDWAVALRLRGEREGRNRSWIELRASQDGGETWSLRSFVSYTGESGGNPPSMVQLEDGRLVVTYCVRDNPHGLRARISTDNGHSWGNEIFLRQDGLSWDIGYPRTVVRPDGKLVTVYYHATQEHPQQFIAATIWDPDAYTDLDQYPRIWEPGWVLRQRLDIGAQEAAGLAGASDIDNNGRREIAIWGRNSRNPSAFLHEISSQGDLRQVWSSGFTGDPATEFNVPLIAIGDVRGNGHKVVAVGRSGADGRTDRVYLHEYSPTVNGGRLGPSNPPTGNPVILQLGTSTISAQPQGITFGDINGNGRNEVLVVTSSPGRSLAIFESEGHGALAFGEPVFTDLGHPAAGASAISAVGDFDGDGSNEVAILLSGGSRLVIAGWEAGAPNIEFETGTLTGTRHRSRVIWGDIDGDGKGELLWTDYNTGRLRIINAVGPNSYEEQEPGGIPLLSGGVTPLAIVATGGDRPRSLWFGVQVSDRVREDIYAIDHVGEIGDFTAAAFTLPRLTVETPGRMMSMLAVGEAPGDTVSLDGNEYLDLIVGFRETQDAPEELYWLEYTGGKLTDPVKMKTELSWLIY